MPEQMMFLFGGAAPATIEPPDAAVRERALDPAQSFIVQAPAGSGKTELLIQRYLTLLARVSAPEAVVAITFTIKAAAEMRERVLEALHSATQPEPEKTHAQRTWRIARAVLERNRDQQWGLVENPSRMRIQTIDALCMSIVRQMPWTARMGAMPDVTEDARRLYERAAESTIRLLAEDDFVGSAVETLVRHLDYDATAARSLLSSMLEVRDHWLPVIGGGQPDLALVRRELEQSLARIVAEGIGKLCACFAPDESAELVHLARYAANNVDAEHDLAALRDLPSLPSDVELWRALGVMLRTSSGEWRKSVTRAIGFPPKQREKERFERLLDRLRGNGELIEALDALDHLPDPSYPDRQWQVLEALFTVLPRAVGELQVIFSERGVVDFTEISQAALRALGNTEHPTDLALVLGHRIEHLLVDEFQDTSRAQELLLRKLTAGWDPGDGRTLFLVGDPMQSIYRFRQAEVGLFLTIRQAGLGSVTLEPLTLATNFRSSRTVVEWNNMAFRDAFPRTEDALVGAVPYSESEAFQPAGDAPGIIVHPLDKESDAEETATVVRLIEEAQGSGESVAVLVRARTHLLETAARLRERGIRFRAVEIDSLGERAAVRDLLALTRAMLHLGDRPAWLATLRAPYCGLTLADLEALANDPQATIWDLARTAASRVSDDGQARLARWSAVMEQALEQRGRMSLRRLVEGAWMALGGPSCLAGDAELADAAAYLDLLEREETGGDLLDLEDFARRVGDLFAAPDPAAPSTLELMTVHKAKGLEFDRVILPGLGRISKRDDQRLLLWTQMADGAILLAPMAARKGKPCNIYRYLEHIDHEKAKQETVRLLYVACTRAKRELHLIGQRPARSGSFLHVLWHVLEEKYGQLEEAEARPEAERQPPPLRRLPADALGGVKVEGSWTAPARTEHAGEAPTPVTPENATGAVIHAFLDRIAQDGLPLWSVDRVRTSRAQFVFALRAQGVDPQGSAERVEEALVRALSDDRGRWILDRHHDAQSEFAVSTVVAGNIVHLRIDRTFVDEAGTRWVIDFKTGAEEPDEHWPQLERYAEVMREFDGRPARLGLYFPLTGLWVERDAQ